jgi:hypothetical protein
LSTHRDEYLKKEQAQSLEYNANTKVVCRPPVGGSAGEYVIVKGVDIQHRIELIL